MRYNTEQFFENNIFIIIFMSISLSLLFTANTKMNKEHLGHEQAKNVIYNSEMDKNIEELFKKKNNAVLKNDKNYLKTIYDIENDLGNWAYENELRKIKYIQNWSKKQGVRFIEINPKVVIRNIKESGDMFSVNLICSTEYKYKYTDQEDINISRVGTNHVLDIVEKDEKLYIIKEWYNDPFAGTIDLENFKGSDVKTFINNQVYKETKDLSVGRKKAIDYASEFAGIASDNKNDFKYNSEYKNYNGEGGDCTNFISQVLLEGGFKKDTTWSYNSGGGTKAWVNANGFKEYLIYSGRGTILSNGDYKSVYQDAYELIEGDIISYEKQGQISHSAVVTGFDSKRYPLVTCHNTDRENVPWDLGFNDSDVKFHLIKMNY